MPDPTPYNLVLPSNFNQNPTQPIDNPLTNEGVALGRQLFYEKALSLDNSVACSSCHQQARAFTDGLARATGVHGGRHARSAMPLQNLLWEKDFAWDGPRLTWRLRPACHCKTRLKWGSRWKPALPSCRPCRST
jgi:cytochrome c peroxidase